MIPIWNAIRNIAAVLMVSGMLLSPAIAEAHDLRADSGFTALLHIDPEDHPQAGHSEVINFLIGKTGASYNQNDYTISLDISSGGTRLQRLSVQPEEFGNAADGITTYTFAHSGTYILDLRGASNVDKSQQFHMRYSLQVSGKAVDATAHNSSRLPILLALAGSGALLAVVIFMTVRSNKR